MSNMNVLDPAPVTASHKSVFDTCHGIFSCPGRRLRAAMELWPATAPQGLLFLQQEWLQLIVLQSKMNVPQH